MEDSSDEPSTGSVTEAPEGTQIQPTKRSKVWSYFSICEDDNLKTTCNLCTTQVSRGRDRNKLTTSNMIYHLRNRHNVFISNTPVQSNSQPSIATALDKQKSYSKSSPRHAEITTALAQMIVGCDLSMRLVETREFKHFIHVMDSRYQSPTRHDLIENIIPTLNEKVMDKVKQKVGGGDVAITTDIWTSRQTVGYLSITAHLIGIDDKRYNFILAVECIRTRHTTDFIKEQVERQLERWGIALDSVAFGVSDNGLNIANAITNLGICNIRCLAHTINLIAESCFGNGRISKAIECCRRIVGHVNSSTSAALDLVDIQVQLGLKPQKVIQDVSSRWNSTYYMIRRFITQRPAITQLANCHDLGAEIDRSQWQILENLVVVLEPLEIVTMELSRDDATISNIVPIIINLAAQYVQLERATNEDNINTYANVRMVIVTIISSIKKRFCSPMEEGDHGRNRRYFYSQRVFEECCMSTFLDARFKQNYFRSIGDIINFSNMVDITKNCALQAMGEHESVTASDLEITEVRPTPQNRSILFMGSPRTEMSSRSSTLANEELEAYITSPVANMSLGPSKYWKSNAACNLYPRLAKIALKYSICPPTSVPSERLFSSMGLVLSPRRSKLKPVNAEMLKTSESEVGFLHEDLCSLFFGEKDSTVLLSNMFTVLVQFFNHGIPSRLKQKTSTMHFEKHLLHICTITQLVQVILQLDYKELKSNCDDEMEFSTENSSEEISLAKKIFSFVGGDIPEGIPHHKLIAAIKMSMLPYLRWCSLYLHLVTKVPPPDVKFNIASYDILMTYLGLPKTFAGLVDPKLEPLITRWCQNPEFHDKRLKDLPKTLRYPAACEVPNLVNLPHDYSDLLEEVADFSCPKFDSEDLLCPTMCLVCRKVVCSQNFCCQEVINGKTVGACNAHSHRCGRGVGLFLRIRECSCILLDSPKRGTYASAPYLDKYGEADKGLRRGNPLYLNKHQLHMVRKLWLSHSIPEQVSHDIESRETYYLDWAHL